MTSIFRKHPYLASGFLLAMAVAIFFAVNVISHVIYWSNHEREAVRPWMTVGYVARSWDLHGPDIDNLAGLPLPVERPLTIKEIATDRGVPVEEIIEKVEAAVAQLVEQRDADHGND